MAYFKGKYSPSVEGYQAPHDEMVVSIGLLKKHRRHRPNVTACTIKFTITNCRGGYCIL